MQDLHIEEAALERRPRLFVVVATGRVADARHLRDLPNVRLYPLNLAAVLGLVEQVLLMLGMTAEQVNRRIGELRQKLGDVVLNLNEDRA